MKVDRQVFDCIRNVLYVFGDSFSEGIDEWRSKHGWPGDSRAANCSE